MRKIAAKTQTIWDNIGKEKKLMKFIGPKIYFFPIFGFNFKKY